MRSVKGQLEKKIINGRTVWFAESHHMVLEAWASYRKLHSYPPDLITLDYHTDLRVAFVLECIELNHPRFPEPEEFLIYADQEAAKLVTLDVGIVRDAVSWLTYEEHIDTAQRAGIIDSVFMMLSSRPGTEPIASRKQHCIWKDASRHKMADALLESDTLGEMIALFETTKQRHLAGSNYILDIDLDYFRTAKAASPTDAKVFHQLIRGAGIITIALEPECVKHCRLSKEKITADSLFTTMLDHIARA